MKAQKLKLFLVTLSKKKKKTCTCIFHSILCQYIAVNVTHSASEMLKQTHRFLSTGSSLSLFPRSIPEHGSFEAKTRLHCYFSVKSKCCYFYSTYLTRILLLVILSNMLPVANFIRPVRFDLQRWQIKREFRVKVSSTAEQKHTHTHTKTVVSVHALLTKRECHLNSFGLPTERRKEIRWKWNMTALTL